jgi:hypothetical protein
MMVVKNTTGIITNPNRWQIQREDTASDPKVVAGHG